MDLAKDTLYIEHSNHPERRAIQTVMYETVVTLAKLVSPILPHTADEVWENTPNVEGESVQLTEMPEARTFGDVEELKNTWNNFMDIRSEILKALEHARNEKVIGKSLEAALTIYADDQKYELLAGINRLEKLFIVSKVHLVKGLNQASQESVTFEHLAVAVTAAEGTVCERCWTVSESVGENKLHPSLCQSCAETVSTHYRDVE